jgi:hypothetical protein
VLEKSNNQHPHLHHLLQHAFFLAERGEESTRIDMERKNHPASIVVYRVPLETPAQRRWLKATPSQPQTVPPIATNQPADTRGGQALSCGLSTKRRRR